MSARRSAAARPLLVAHNIVFRTPAGEPLLDRISLSLPSARTGLVGRNGVGKTTLARLLAGELRPDSGSIRSSARIAYLPQRLDDLAGRTIASLFDPRGTPDAGALDAAAAAALARLGLRNLQPNTTMRELSGGEQIRTMLAALIARQPDLLILDEPTNNLDATAREILSDLASTWRRGLLIITHDRRLLMLMDQILELVPGSLRCYGGNYDLYTRQRAAESAAAEHDAAHAARDLARAKRDRHAVLERQGHRDARGRAQRQRGDTPKAVLNAMRNTADRTGARLRDVHNARVDAAAASLRQARQRLETERKFAFALQPVKIPQGKLVLTIQDLWFTHGCASAELFAGLNLRLIGPRRMAIAGGNGAGKSTLLRLITGELHPQRGRIHIGVPRLALLDQHAAVLHPHQSLLENFQRLNPQIPTAAARLALARFLFREDAALRPACALSGGERLRAALACVLSGPEPPELLMLDEPANHLDLECLEHVEAALRSYHGALIVVSHDQTFLDAIGIELTVVLSSCASIGSLQDPVRRQYGGGATDNAGPGD